MPFKLTSGADTFEFDTSGKGTVTKNGAAFGAWDTDATNRVRANPTGGGTPVTFTVTWEFKKNELTLSSGATSFNFDTDRRPRYSLDSGVIRVRPLASQTHEFGIQGGWTLKPDMTLEFKTPDGKASVLSGSLTDTKGRFLYIIRSEEPANASHQSVLLFAGRWAKDPADQSKLNFLYKRTDVDGKVSEGTFVLPGSFQFSGGDNQLVYKFTGSTATHQVTIVGSLRISPSFQISYSIKNQIAAGIVGSEIVIDAVIANDKLDGTLQLAVSKPGGGETTFSIQGAFTHIRLGGTEVGIGFAIAGGSGATPLTVAIHGTFDIDAGGKVTFTFEKNAKFTKIGVTADQIKLGKFTASASATVTLQNGSLASVEVMFGITFPLHSVAAGSGQ